MRKIPDSYRDPNDVGSEQVIGRVDSDCDGVPSTAALQLRSQSMYD